MKFLTMLLAGSLAALHALASAPDPTLLHSQLKEARAAQYDWQQMPASTPQEKSAREAERVRANEAVARAASAFLTAFPEEPRRWEAWSALAGAERKFAGPLAQADELAWQAMRRDVQQKLLNDPSVPVVLWERAMTSEVIRHLKLAEKSRKDTGKADTTAWRESLDLITRRAPQATLLGPFEGHYADFLRQDDANASERHLQGLVSSPNPKVAEMAQGKLNALAAERGPMELRFTAADGREVDLAKLRGKVVIIDFWATWCVPCLKEFPNTKAAYEAYKNQGVEMIGISFDFAPKDSAKPSKSDRTREQFLADAARMGMDWPQYYDGKGWECEIGRRFNIVTIPRIWVLNKEGVLQTQFAYGRKLWDLLGKLTGKPVPIPPEFAKEEGSP